MQTKQTLMLERGSDGVYRVPAGKQDINPPSGIAKGAGVAGLAGIYLLAAVAGAGLALGSGQEPQAVPVELAQQLDDLRAATEELRREISAERHRQAQIREEIELQEMIAIVDSFGLPEFAPEPISDAEIDPVLRRALESAAQYEWDGLTRVMPANG